jgi:hypothetical protein
MISTDLSTERIRLSHHAYPVLYARPIDRGDCPTIDLWGKNNLAVRRPRWWAVCFYQGEIIPDEPGVCTVVGNEDGDVADNGDILFTRVGTQLNP